jgi:pSer/pThr/pTyr-binding forkhead associated (FHA) protein
MTDNDGEITLTLLHPTSGAPIQSWSFRDEAIIRIGRASDNEVVIRSDVVSRYHAELRRHETEWDLVGLGTNGTFVNGERITQFRLTDGQAFVLAPTGPTLGFRFGRPAQDVMEQTMHIKFLPNMGLAVDEKKKTMQVAEITESDYFQRLQAKLAALRAGKAGSGQ